MQITRSVGIVVCLVLVPLASFCSKSKSAGEASKSYQVEDLWIETSRITFKDHVRYGSGNVETKSSSESKVSPEASLSQACQGKALARENVEDPGGSDEFISITYSCIDAKGVGHYAMVIPEQRSTESYELKYELFNPVRIGKAWSSQTKGEAGDETRSCELRASRYCQDGVASVCVTEKSGGAFTWMRQHYCEKQGWRGYEVVTARAGTIGMQSWSSDVVADGVTLENVGEPTDLPDAAQVLIDAKSIAEAANKAQ